MKLKKEGDSVFLCCGRARCPKLKKSQKDDNTYELTDDFGGKVSLTKEQLLIIGKAVDSLDGN